MIKSDDEYYNDIMEDVDDILAGKKVKTRTTTEQLVVKRRTILEYLTGVLVLIVGVPVGVFVWFVWDFIPSFGVLVMLSLVLAFGITYGVNFVVPELLDLKFVWGILSGMSFLYIMWPILTMEVF